ncbi:hypothetical protein ACVC7V_00505 [Hydrogenophaga sp. A37]|uniref:hypothetical protein n=1 Tax=Hydrogenophaga sp. A37 TaxID=1945864 RepID=UPI00117A8993|nr:hypothetical protein [Hydrogenophaga sp. A37]
MNPSYRFTFEDNWEVFPMAFWVHTRADDGSNEWSPPVPMEVQHKGFPVLRVDWGQHELQFSAPGQLAHFIDVLSTKPLPTSKILSARKNAPVGPNGHWLSRLPGDLKSPRTREKLVDAMRQVYSEAVTRGGSDFKVKS